MLGKLPDARYAVLDAQYSKEQGALADEIFILEQQMQSMERVKKSADRFIGIIERYEHFDVLTNRMLNELVQKIVIHEREHKGCQDTVQEIEIYFNFVGQYVPPHFGEVVLTQEEQEAQRIKQTIREKRHQNYLRRKANGSQQLIDARYKAKKKAQMEAQNEAIRKEDIAKGIFQHSNAMPKKGLPQVVASNHTAPIRKGL